MYLISGNITSNVTGNLPVITGNGNIGNITSNFRTLTTTKLPLLLLLLLLLLLWCSVSCEYR